MVITKSLDATGSTIIGYKCNNCGKEVDDRKLPEEIGWISVGGKTDKHYCKDCVEVLYTSCKRCDKVGIKSNTTDGFCEDCVDYFFNLK